MSEEGYRYGGSGAFLISCKAARGSRYLAPEAQARFGVQPQRYRAPRPKTMSEQYYAVNGQMTSGMASYANFRRFDAAVRVLSPEAPR